MMDRKLGTRGRVKGEETSMVVEDSEETNLVESERSGTVYQNRWLQPDSP